MYNLGERRISRTGYFSFFQVHLLNLHILNCTETSQDPEKQQKAAIRIVICLTLCVLESKTFVGKELRIKSNH